MIRSKGRNKRPLEDSEFDAEKKMRFLPTPGSLRLMKDIEALENEPNIVLEMCEDLSRVKVEYRVDQGRELECPNRFEVLVAKRYPHDAPNVRCLDPGFVCRFIDENGLVHHSSLTEEWTAICSLTNIVEALQYIRSLFLNVNDPSAIETINRSCLFDLPIPPADSVHEAVNEAVEEEDMPLDSGEQCLEGQEQIEAQGQGLEENSAKLDSSDMTIVYEPHSDGPVTLSSF